MCSCKRNIEEEEAAAEAKVRSLQAEDSPHPSLFGIKPPSPEVLIHVQTSSGAEVCVCVLNFVCVCITVCQTLNVCCVCVCVVCE